jgi:CRISPR-associated protein Cas5d
MTGDADPEPFWADDMDDEQNGRTQRQTMALKAVRYRLYGHMRFRSQQVNPKEFDEQFVRRARQGKCFYQPYFGCREFPAYFALVEDSEILSPGKRVGYTVDLGLMIYDTYDLRKDNDEFAPQFISLFQATVTGGVMNVPPYDSQEVLKPGV